MRRWSSLAVAVLACVTAVVLGRQSDAHAAPFRTVAVEPDLAACHGEPAAANNAACAAALTRLWLGHRGRSSVVRETVMVQNPGAGVSWNSENSDICVYAELGTLLNLGLHHCDKTTFFNPQTDAALISTRNRAVTTFVHESSHGVQESIGLKPVSTTVFGPADDIRRLELASDCWSGAGWTWLIAQGHLTQSDLGQATAFMYSLPDRATHGSGAERGQAFERGVAEGVAACDEILGRSAYT
ncbi:hypothetical protein GTV32_13995 [Gordonia sp. SID5947]|uniref:hypothetical protein n=1 Tax=Gordonia sp. SID5947 TaxID=2690315 RepID=UPI001369CCD6|nr:hypothetical protein [Gordonia sp. SID5947]MYR07354.1 hypothetical protein [Gordonia sp. SID5947]